MLIDSVDTADTLLAYTLTVIFQGIRQMPGFIRIHFDKHV